MDSIQKAVKLQLFHPIYLLLLIVFSLSSGFGHTVNLNGEAELKPNQTGEREMIAAEGSLTPRFAGGAGKHPPLEADKRQKPINCEEIKIMNVEKIKEFLLAGSAASKRRNMTDRRIAPGKARRSG